MMQANHGVGSRPGDEAPALQALTSRSDWSPRVRRLMEGVLNLCSTCLERAIAAALDDTEAQLFKSAEQSRNNEAQYRCFETLREIKRGRADVTPRLMLAMEDKLARFDRGSAPAESGAPARPGMPARKELALVETRELEESLALQEFAAKNDVRQAPALFLLGHRFGVLAGAPAFDAETLAIGPARLADALQHAAACLDISAEHRVLLFRSFDKACQTAIGELYAGINHYFVEQRILPHLQASAAKLAKGSGENRAAPPSEDSASPETPAAGPPPADPRGAALRSGAMPANPGQHMPSPGIFTPPPGVYPSPGMAARAMPAPDDRDAELFTTLRELLAGRRSALGVPDAMPANAYVPSSNDLQSVLGTLQAKPIAPMMMGGKLVQRSIGHLKQDLLSHLRQQSPDGQAPQLTAEDSDTIDLVGMLFDYLTKNVRPNGSTQSLMTKLQVPLLRVALRDKNFFTRRSHPARQLLNAIAETGTHWLDDSEGPADRALVDKMQVVVDKVSHEFDGNLGLIEGMLTDLSQHMHTLARKAEVTERRHVDAAKGREKLAVAREQAQAAIAGRIVKSKPNKLVRTLLEQAWTDVLALTLLRQGEDSEVYTRRLQVADQLIAATGTRAEAKAPPELRGEIETALDQVGYHKDDVQAVVKRLFTPDEVADGEEAVTNTEIAIKLKSKPRLGDDATAAPPPAPRQRKTYAPDSPEARALERIKTLPFGSWFEFRTNQQGDTVRRKLAWFSTLTGNCLFVNQRGMRVEERTLDQLARDMVTGQVSFVEPETETLVDRAWKAIVSSLKQMVGRGPEPAPMPA
ncbi:MAG: DUF1631 domain-containing protein [Proteobacteria bacterium]|nr:DUF1631 domain-containing protein [Pseudomonadota bacterium]